MVQYLSIHPFAQDTEGDSKHNSDQGKLVGVSCRMVNCPLWAAFPIWVSFFVFWEMLMATGSFTACGLDRLALTSWYHQLWPQRQHEYKPWCDPQMCQGMGDANKSLSSVLAGGKLRDLDTLPAGLNVYRPCSAAYLPVGRRRRLWKPHDSEDLDSGPLVSPGMEHLPGCRFWKQVSMFSGAAQ
jgi:hypothetical protein